MYCCLCRGHPACLQRWGSQQVLAASLPHSPEVRACQHLLQQPCSSCGCTCLTLEAWKPDPSSRDGNQMRWADAVTPHTFLPSSLCAHVPASLSTLPVDAASRCGYIRFGEASGNGQAGDEQLQHVHGQHHILPPAKAQNSPAR